MRNTPKEASFTSSEINIIQNSANNNNGDPETSKRSNITSTTTKVDNLTKLLLQDFDFVEESFEAVKRKASQVIDEVHEARNKFKKLMLLPEGHEGRDTQLQELKRKVFKLKSLIPFNLIAPPEQNNPHVNWRPRPHPEEIKEISLFDLVSRNMERSLVSSRMSLELDSSVTNGLSFLARRCLMFILEFPPNTIIKRSILLMWLNASWINETPHFIEAVVMFDREMHSIVAKGFIEAIHKKSSLTVAGYRMNHSNHYTLSHSKWPSPFPEIRQGICLAHGVDKDDENIFYGGSTSQFPAKKYLKVLHLGKWKNSTEQHIEFIDQPELFFKGVSVLSRLEYLSLRGISMVQELPKFITKLTTLAMLDLQSCHNLEVIPSDITKLRSTLTHLDMSKCYFLEHMPKALATLDRLQVLKGFFVGELKDEKSCTLEDLSSLHELVKLNIYTSMKEFPNTSQLRTLQKFPSLRNLAISWGGCKSSQRDKYGDFRSSARKLNHSEVKTKGASETTSRVYLVFYLTKLDLQCVPQRATLGWLRPTNFESLKRLYTRGGKFNDLGQGSEQDHWNVEILPLKHLSRLELIWDEIQRLFPKLIHLEKVKCPNLDGFPCDDDGVWTVDEEGRLRFNKY